MNSLRLGPVLTLVGMSGGNDLIHGKKSHQKDAENQGRPGRKPLDQGVQAGGHKVNDSQGAHTEEQQPFGADPAVQVQKISGIIPPSLALVEIFQIERNKILQNAGEQDGGKKFPHRIFAKPVQQGEDQEASRAVDGKPGAVQHATVHENVACQEGKPYLPEPSGARQRKVDQHQGADGIGAQAVHGLVAGSAFLCKKVPKPQRVKLFIQGILVGGKLHLPFHMAFVSSDRRRLYENDTEIVGKKAGDPVPGVHKRGGLL